MMIKNEMKECITNCWTARSECQETLFNYCLYEGSSKMSPEVFKLMSDCIQACQTAADFMTRNSAWHAAMCAACAECCEACAKACESTGDSQLKKCAECCRKCASSCREMGKLSSKAA